VHRVLPVPGRLSRPIRDHEGEQARVFAGGASSSSGRLDMHRWTRWTARPTFQDAAGRRPLATSPSCCTEAVPSTSISPTRIIPLKERMADEFFDPVVWLLRKFRSKKRAARVTTVLSRHSCRSGPVTPGFRPATESPCESERRHRGGRMAMGVTTLFTRLPTSPKA